jgi:colanic acid biosynthesis glycosyl transferase WcaI
VKIVFFNRFFYPDASATSQILSDLAFHLAGEGANVHVVTSRVRGATEPVENVRGVTVHRVSRAIEGPHGLARRALAYLAYYRGARRTARTLLEAGDVAVVKTDPPMLSSAIGPVARDRGARVIAWMQDIFPEVAQQYGVPGMAGPLGRYLRRLRTRSLLDADRVVAIGERMSRRITDQGIAHDRLRVIHNWADGEVIRPLPREGNALRARWDLEGVFVAQYSGNLGRVHEFDTILEAARMLRGDPALRFLIVGQGPRLAEVRLRAERDGLANVTFEPPQERSVLGESLAVGDVHLCVLEPRFDGLVLPSKLYGIMAAGRPTVFIGDPAGETAAILDAAGCGVSVASGDAPALVAALRKLAQDDALREALGRRARESFERNYAMPIAMARWRETLREAGYIRS